MVLQNIFTAINLLITLYIGYTTCSNLAPKEPVAVITTEFV